MQYRLAIFLLTIIAILVGTTILVRYGQGYRLSFNQGNSLQLTTTGLLVANSYPEGASVYIDDKLVTASNNTVNLAPGQYQVRIVKEGYLPWEKKLTIEKEVATQTQALLIPIAPRLESITATGVFNPTPDPTGTRLAFGVASASAAKRNGVFVLDMNNRPIISLQSNSLQLADNSTDRLSNGAYTWSPNGEELLVATKQPTQTLPTDTYHLFTNGFNAAPQEVTNQLPTILDQWEKDKEVKDKAHLDSLKPDLANFISKNMKIMAWSYQPEDTKILYEASASATLPQFIKPALIGANDQPEERSIKPGRIYVYDTKEDKNFFIHTKDTTIQNPVWFPDNRHLVFVEDKQIKMVEYDGTNKTVIYSGPFENNFVFPWPDGSRLVILTSLNPQPGMAANLYTISLR